MESTQPRVRHTASHARKYNVAENKQDLCGVSRHAKITTSFERSFSKSLGTKLH